MAALGNGTEAALTTLYRLVQQPAWLLAFADVYKWHAGVALGAIVLVLFVRKVKVQNIGVGH
jgi:hypothetical protein